MGRLDSLLMAALTVLILWTFEVALQLRFLTEIAPRLPGNIDGELPPESPDAIPSLRRPPFHNSTVTGQYPDHLSYDE